MYSIKVTVGGRVVIPVEIRKALGVAEGETLWVKCARASLF
jgi:AbrB family looped-hinge helix DNA binding protein